MAARISGGSFLPRRNRTVGPRLDAEARVDNAFFIHRWKWLSGLLAQEPLLNMDDDL